MNKVHKWVVKPRLPQQNQFLPEICLCNLHGSVSRYTKAALFTRSQFKIPDRRPDFMREAMAICFLMLPQFIINRSSCHMTLQSLQYRQHHYVMKAEIGQQPTIHCKQPCRAKQNFCKISYIGKTTATSSLRSQQVVRKVINSKATLCL